MAFHQLYYTSCENGLAGYGGYQFNAVTPGVSAAVMREVEDGTVYEPPRALLAEPCPDEPEAYPVAFSHGISEATGAAITSHVMFAGEDYSGRPGNYFAHALVTDRPERDFGPLLPVELWGSRLWRGAPVEGAELPELPGPPPAGVVDRPAAQAFLDARGAEGVVPELLTAVDRAMRGGRPVLLASQDVTENVWWIAVVSYLLGERLGRGLTFTSYSHRPGYSRYHLIGVLSDALPPDADAAFQLFDMDARYTPGHGTHPLAGLLAGAGVMGAPGIWRQAGAFAAEDEADFGDWLAPVAAAAGLLGTPLAAGELDVVARWLPGVADRLPAEHADVVLGVLLGAPGLDLSPAPRLHSPGASPLPLADERLRDLLDLARRLPLPARVEHLEALLVERAFTHIARDEPAEPVRLTGPAVRTARTRAVRVLGARPPAATAAMILEWSAASGVTLPAAELERYGRSGLNPNTPELARIVRGRPAVLRGLIDRLAGEPAPFAQALLDGAVGKLIVRDDLAGHPGLTELWLLLDAAHGRTEPLRAFDEIVDVRAGARRSPRVDRDLLARLWPQGCPASQLAELLGTVTRPPEPDAAAWPPDEAVLDWFAEQIKKAADASEGGWPRLVQELGEHPIRPMLPKDVADITAKAVEVAPLLKRARERDLGALADLYAAYESADERNRRRLEVELPHLLADADPLGRALRGCPDAVVRGLRAELLRRFAPVRGDVALAARVFVALGHADVTTRPEVVARLHQALARLLDWGRGDLKDVAKALEHDEPAARRFQAWRDDHRGWAGRLLFGGPPDDPGGRR